MPLRPIKIAASMCSYCDKDEQQASLMVTCTNFAARQLCNHLNESSSLRDVQK